MSLQAMVYCLAFRLCEVDVQQCSSKQQALLQADSLGFNHA